MWRSRWLALVVGALAVGGCGSPSIWPTSAGAQGPLRVVATTSQTADFARAVGGDRVVVRSLARQGIDAHDFEPAPVDLEAIRTAAVVVRNGAGLDRWLDDAVRASGSHAIVADASAGVALRGPAGTVATAAEVRAGDADPHIWQDPDNAARMVSTIAAAFTAADPAGTPHYAQALAGYLGQLHQLDAEVRAELAPIANRKVVTNHDAFGYYLDRYGLILVDSVVPTFDASAELSAADVRRLVAKLRAEGATAIFVETTLPAKTAHAIAAEAGVDVVDGPDALYGDALGPPGSEGATYLGMMRHNTRVLAEHLR